MTSDSLCKGLNGQVFRNDDSCNDAHNATDGLTGTVPGLEEHQLPKQTNNKQLNEFPSECEANRPQEW